MSDVNQTESTHRAVEGGARTESARTGLLSFSIGLDVLLVAMLGLGIGIASGANGLRDVHGIVGYSAVLIGAIAAFFAFRYAKAVGQMGSFFHALSLPILMIVQIGLGEMGQEMVHMVLGVLILVGAFALTTIANKKPAAQASAL